MQRRAAISLTTPPAASSWRAKTTLWLLVGAWLGSSAGCGQKGPLTLPGAAKGATAPASAPASR
jgi:predicted small lipoprotein YifL